MRYFFERKEHMIELKPHGNAKRSDAVPYRRTMPSTVKALKDALPSHSPKFAVNKIYEEKGGISNAFSGSLLPRNVRQAYNLNRKGQTENSTNLKDKSKLTHDPLAAVMLDCKESYGKKDSFIRLVACAPEPMCILASDQQLDDLVRFCTGDNGSILTVDPTFNLGPFYVTPIAYRQLLCESGRGTQPVMLSPILVHQSKGYPEVHFFTSSLLSLRPELTNIKAFGTDGENALINALKVSFPNATHLRCTNHLRDNIKRKLRELGVPQHVGKEFLGDIFGVNIGQHFEGGLADSGDSMVFQASLVSLERKWNNCERSCHGDNYVPSFYDWFCKTLAVVFMHSVIPEARKAANADTTRLFTTNASEALNNVIKMEVQWKQNELPQLIEHLKLIADRQIASVEQAVVGKGDWKLLSDYEYLQVDELQWFKKSESERHSHLKRVFQCKPNASASNEVAGNIPVLDELVKDVPPKELLDISAVPQTTLKQMWSKAMELIKSGYVTEAPWMREEKARCVASASSDIPHIVTTSKNSHSRYECTPIDKCIAFKGFGLCSHVLAATADNGHLISNLVNYSSSCKLPNLTALARHSMPKGTGKKGGVPNYKRQRRPATSSSTRIQPSLEVACCSKTLTGQSNAPATGIANPSQSIQQPTSRPTSNSSVVQSINTPSVNQCQTVGTSSDQSIEPIELQPHSSSQSSLPFRMINQCQSLVTSNPAIQPSQSVQLQFPSSSRTTTTSSHDSNQCVYNSSEAYAPTQPSQSISLPAETSSMSSKPTLMINQYQGTAPCKSSTQPIQSIRDHDQCPNLPNLDAPTNHENNQCQQSDSSTNLKATQPSQSIHLQSTNGSETSSPCNLAINQYQGTALHNSPSTQPFQSIQCPTSHVTISNLCRSSNSPSTVSQPSQAIHLVSSANSILTPSLGMGSINQYQATAALGSNPSIQTNLLGNIMGLLAQMNQEKKIDDPFWVVHLAGNISRCCGCKGKIVRDSELQRMAHIPSDVVIQHEEFVLFQNPNTGVFQLSREKRNVYYHFQKSCILKQWATFEPRSHLKVSHAVLHKLTDAHHKYLQTEFGIQWQA